MNMIMPAFVPYLTHVLQLICNRPLSRIPIVCQAYRVKVIRNINNILVYVYYPKFQRSTCNLHHNFYFSSEERALNPFTLSA